MNVTNDRFKDRQLHIEDYLQMVSTESKEYAEVSACQRIAENNRIITVLAFGQRIADTQISQCRSCQQGDV